MNTSSNTMAEQVKKLGRLPGVQEQGATLAGTDKASRFYKVYQNTGSYIFNRSKQRNAITATTGDKIILRIMWGYTPSRAAKATGWLCVPEQGEQDYKIAMVYDTASGYGYDKASHAISCVFLDLYKQLAIYKGKQSKVIEERRRRGLYMLDCDACLTRYELEHLRQLVRLAGHNTKNLKCNQAF